MIITTEDVIREARSWKGTKFTHQGRSRECGIDCVGLLIEVAHTLGISNHDSIDYDRHADGETLMRHVRDHLDLVQGTPAPGLIGVFRWRRYPQHVGIFGEDNGRLTLIHTYANIGKCVEHGLDEVWHSRIVNVWRYRGVV